MKESLVNLRTPLKGPTIILPLPIGPAQGTFNKGLGPLSGLRSQHAGLILFLWAGGRDINKYGYGIPCIIQASAMPALTERSYHQNIHYEALETYEAYLQLHPEVNLQS